MRVTQKGKGKEKKEKNLESVEDGSFRTGLQAPLETHGKVSHKSGWRRSFREGFLEVWCLTEVQETARREVTPASVKESECKGPEAGQRGPESLENTTHFINILNSDFGNKQNE